MSDDSIITSWCTVSGQEQPILVNGEQPEGFAINLTKNQKDHYGQQFDEDEKPGAPGIIGNKSKRR